jgi:hypothetical protein
MTYKLKKIERLFSFKPVYIKETMAKYFRATYTTSVIFDIPEGVEATKDNSWVKWNTLYIEKDDGTTIEIEGETKDIDWKRPDEEELLDKDYNPI